MTLYGCIIKPLFGSEKENCLLFEHVLTFFTNDFSLYKSVQLYTDPKFEHECRVLEWIEASIFTQYYTCRIYNTFYSTPIVNVFM